jgi:tRNA(Arg) A34 adenosine deaminase TadA
MRQLLILLVSLTCFCLHTVAADPAAVIEERHELFTLATLAVTYSQLLKENPVGHPISAALAWNIEDTTRTPDFVVDMNRNLQNQSELYHAEVSTLQRAWKRKVSPYPPGLRPVEKRSHYGSRLEKATLYTTLEPCPMCSATALMSHIPRIFFAMEDPAFRDPKTHALVQPLVGAFYGRKIESVGSQTVWAKQLNTKVWQAEEQVFSGALTDPKAVWTDSHGITRLNLISYLYREGKSLFKPGYDAFTAYQVKHPENAGLYRALMKDLFPALQIKTH